MSAFFPAPVHFRNPKITIDSDNGKLAAVLHLGHYEGFIGIDNPADARALAANLIEAADLLESAMGEVPV